MAKIESLRSRVDPKHDLLCSRCEKHYAPVIFIDNPRDRQCDIHLTCDVCFDPVCADCCETDEEGNVTCASCIEQKALDERLGRSTPTP